MITITVLNHADDKYYLDVNGVKLIATKRGDSDSYIVYFNNKVSGISMSNKTIAKSVLDDALANNKVLTYTDSPRASGTRNAKAKATLTITDNSIDFMYNDFILLSLKDVNLIKALKTIEAAKAKAETLAGKIATAEALGLPVDDQMIALILKAIETEADKK